jgi:hypothetical protein
MLVPPPAGERVELVRGPNIQSLPAFEPLPDSLEGPVLLKLDDNVRENLINFGILPLTFADPEDWTGITLGHILRLPDVREAIQHGNQVHLLNQDTGEMYVVGHGMTERQLQIVLDGSLLERFRARHAAHGA